MKILTFQEFFLQICLIRIKFVVIKLFLTARISCDSKTVSREIFKLKGGLIKLKLYHNWGYFDLAMLPLFKTEERGYECQSPIIYIWILSINTRISIKDPKNS